jgi:hypothetical protein
MMKGDVAQGWKKQREVRNKVFRDDAYEAGVPALPETRCVCLLAFNLYRDLSSKSPPSKPPIAL